jgi:HD superfamily phosphohydrolase
MQEVVSIAALLHDVTHVPFGHTLEDEFTGIYAKHDSMGSPRLYSLLFDERSELSRVFSDDKPQWVGRLRNPELAELLWLILSWKESIDPPEGFVGTIAKAKRKSSGTPNLLKRIERLEGAHERSTHQDADGQQLFHPFMSDIVGNTICADLLDYLARDRINLGMEYRLHNRLQRYLTIAEGSYYVNEGLRLSVMVTRRGRGGQRPDVVTAVLDIMRDRYEMAERVFYHHKKAAASAMLARLVELSGVKKPRDDDDVYPAPWERDAIQSEITPHMLHLSDAEFLHYLGREVMLPTQVDRDLQRRLYVGLRYRRDGLYRTLLVVDPELVRLATAVPSVTKAIRDTDGGRAELERGLCDAGGVPQGSVLVYCPSDRMQAKEVDARLETREGRVVPLRIQKEAFTYRQDLSTLKGYYEELWRAYVVVDATTYDDSSACRRIVEAFCKKFRLPVDQALRKVRKLDLLLPGSSPAGATNCAFTEVLDFLENQRLSMVPDSVLIRFMRATTTMNRGQEEAVDEWLTRRLQIEILSPAPEDAAGMEADLVAGYRSHLETGESIPQPCMRTSGAESMPFTEYRKILWLQAVTWMKGRTSGERKRRKNADR